MDAVPPGIVPRRLDAPAPPDAAGEGAELAALAAAGVELAPLVWVPPAAEEAFYRLNHLPTRLADLFAPVAERDPDEDDVEDLIPEARALLARHHLLDAWVDAFYDAIAPLPEAVRVRRPHVPGRRATRGRPALLAVRATWADDWTFDATLARLRASGSVALEATPLLVGPADEVPAPPELAARVRDALGGAREAWADGAGRVTRLASAARPRGTARRR